MLMRSTNSTITFCSVPSPLSAATAARGCEEEEGTVARTGCSGGVWFAAAAAVVVLVGVVVGWPAVVAE